MPNHVTNKIIFATEHAHAVFSRVIVDGRFDFESLVPPPPNMYRGSISLEDEKDFPVNCLSWQRQNWGTKWNAYDCKNQFSDAEGKAVITFDTAWAPPYPVMAAFANVFQVPFEHRYFDEGGRFWGIEIWDASRWNDRIHRKERRFSIEEDKKSLCIELKGYDPDSRDEDEGDAA